MSSGPVVPKKKARKSYSAVFDIFAGSYVNIALKNIKGENSKPGRIANLMFAGYLLDEDTEYFFIGQEADAVYAAIKKDEVAAIIMGDEVTSLMEEIDVPDGQSVQ